MTDQEKPELVESQPIPPGVRNNFQTLLHAAANDDLCALAAVRIADNKPVTLLCAVSRREDRSMDMVPLAMMLDDENPYEAYRPCTAEVEEENGDGASAG